MAQVSNYSGTKTETGVITLSVAAGDITPDLTGIAIAIEGAVGDCTITVVPAGCATARNPGADGENIVAENGTIVLDTYLPLASVIITPTDTGTEYTIQWNQF